MIIKKNGISKNELSKEEKREKLKNIIGGWVFVSFSVPIIFLLFRIISIDDSFVDPETLRTKGDYVLMLVQCLLGLVALGLPNKFLKRKNIQIPDNMYIIYVLFLYCAIFLGEIRSFYYTVPHWDTILHTFSGGMIGALGFSFLSVFNKTENLHLKLTPFFVALFGFMFSVTLGVVWEIYEFTVDGLLGLNMQKFMVQPGEIVLIGREALMDTMKDLIVDTAGAFVMSVIGYISLKHKKGWLDGLMIKFKHK